MIISGKGRKMNLLLRSASEPFNIPLQDYGLSSDTFIQYSGRKKTRKEYWYRNEVKFVSFGGGRLILTIAFDKEKETLTLNIEKEELAIRCSCGSFVPALCVHAYRYLFVLAHYCGECAFTAFAPAGIIETALSARSFFSWGRKGKHGIEVELKRNLGRVYALQRMGVTGAHFDAVSNLPGEEQELAVVQAKEKLCYLLMMSPRDEFAPFILPVPGTLNKEGTGIKSFGHYLFNLQKDAINALITGEESPRVDACLSILKKSRLFENLADYDEFLKHPDALADLFREFQTHLFLFANTFLFTCPYYGQKHLDARPVKAYLHGAEVDAAKPLIEFTLRDKEGCYALTMAIRLSGKVVKDDNATSFFFIVVGQGEKRILYLFFSLRDAGIAYWMKTNKGLITIFKNHFPQFEKEILSKLRQHYTIKVISRKEQTTHSKEKEVETHKT